MYTFFVDLHTLLAVWAKTYDLFIYIVLIFFMIIPIIYLSIKYWSEPVKTGFFETNIEAQENFIELVNTHPGPVYLYPAAYGLLLGFMFQASSTSVYALLLSPALSLVMLGVTVVSLNIQRQWIKQYKKEQAIMTSAVIVDPKEAAEARQLKRFN